MIDDLPEFRLRSQAHQTNHLLHPSQNSPLISLLYNLKSRLRLPTCIFHHHKLHYIQLPLLLLLLLLHVIYPAPMPVRLANQDRQLVVELDRPHHVVLVQ